MPPPACQDMLCFSAQNRDGQSEDTLILFPGAGDVALWSQSAEVVDVPARSREALTLSLLSRADLPVAGRTLEVEYYVLGMRRTMSVPIDG